MKPKLVYCFPATKAFVVSDGKILSKEYHVVQQHLPWFDKRFLVFNFIRQFFFLLWHVRSAEKVVIAFGGYWSYLPTRFARYYNKDSYIILHGTDCVSFPKLKYGMLRKRLARYFIEKSYQRATKLLPVSESLIYTENAFYTKDKIIKQGFQHFFPQLTTDFQVVYNGLDTDFWKPLEHLKRNENQFFAAFTAEQWQLKNGDLILNLAKHYPKSIFKIAGVSQAFIDGKKQSENVYGLGVQSKENMRMHYSESTYFLQLAISEGFGLALAEAMLCGCIPIGAAVNTIPKIIGDCGYILKENMTNPLVILVNDIKQKNDLSLGECARNHIIKHFALVSREANLLKTIH